MFTLPAVNIHIYLLNSKQHVVGHGELFTTPCLVESMLDLDKAETERIDTGLLEPTCGSGIFFCVQILKRKLIVVEFKYGKSDFERRYYALLALMCIYVVSQNLVHSDVLTMCTHDGQTITFVEWGYLGNCKLPLRDLSLELLVLLLLYRVEGSLFANLEQQELFTPIKTYLTMTVSNLADFAMQFKEPV